MMLLLFAIACLCLTAAALDWLIERGAGEAPVFDFLGLAIPDGDE